MLGIAIVEDDRDHAALLEAHIRQYAAEPPPAGIRCGCFTMR